jgi:hypothetical protein
MLWHKAIGAGGTGGAVGGPEFVGGYVTRITGSKGEYSVPLTLLTGGLSSSPSAGDIVIFLYVAYSSAPDPDQGGLSYTEVVDVNFGSAKVNVYYKVLTSAEITIDWDLGVNYSDLVGAVYVWRGVDQSTPLDASTVLTTGVNPPSITTVTNNSIVIALVGGDDGGEAVLPITISGMENLFTYEYNRPFLAIASYLQETAGSYDPPAFNPDEDPGGPTWSATLALRPE